MLSTVIINRGDDNADSVLMPESACNRFRKQALQDRLGRSALRLCFACSRLGNCKAAAVELYFTQNNPKVCSFGSVVGPKCCFIRRREQSLLHMT